MGKKIFFILSVLLLIMPVLADDQEEDVLPSQYDQGLVRPYAAIPYKNMMLVSNFGYEKEGTGFISAIQAGVVKTFTRVDGHLSEPRGMVVYDNLLFIADKNKIVVYNLKKIVSPPVEILFQGKEDVVLSDLTVVGSMLLISANNESAIYGIDLKNTKIISQAKPHVIVKLKDVNRLLVYDANLLISSASLTDESASYEGTVYIGSLTRSPKSQIVPFIEGLPQSNKYYGMALVEDHTSLYLSSIAKDETENQAQLFVYSIEKKELKKLSIDHKLTEPTSMVVKSSNLWIVDHKENKVYRYNIY